jgi:endogenous inhibitor of DNA gyrase (YacG/DUF329 family)
MSDAPACVLCRERPVDPRWRPFCSERCQKADLGRWLLGIYRVEAEPAAGTGAAGRPDEDD